MMSRTFYVIQHVPHEDLGTWDRLFQKKKIRLRWIRPFRGQRIPPSTRQMDGLIVMGGPMGVYEQKKYPFLKQEIQLIQSALKSQMPLLGICLGSQLIAEAAGGKVYKGKTQEIGWYPVQLTAAGRRHPLFQGFKKQFMVFQWHGDTFRLPKKVVSLCRSTRFSKQAFVVAPRAVALQFHVEMNAQLIRKWIRVAQQTPQGLSQSCRKQMLEKMPKLLPVLKAQSAQLFENVCKVWDGDGTINDF